MEKEIELEGIIDNIIFQNIENGYTVFSLSESADEDEEEIICVAFMDQTFEGESIKVIGKFIMHSQYGRQFQVQKFSKSTPTSLIGIEKYLGSGLIKGVGEKMAKKIVSTFKEDTFKIIEEFPEKLSKIKGITLDKALAIGEVFKEQEEQRRAILYLYEFGVTPAYASKIYNKYKGNTIANISTNPYRLADDIFGVGFTIADNIATKLGFDKNSSFRIKAGLKYILTQASSNGHTYLPKDMLVGKGIEMLEMDKEVIENCLIEMQIEKRLWQEKTEDGITAVYLNSYYYAESYTAKRLLELSSYFLADKKYIEFDMEKVEQKTGISLADQQKQAVIDSLTNGVLVVTGGPGTGKTTTIKTIIKVLEDEGFTIELAAPTGRATKRMTEATGKEAKTIHRLLGVYFMQGNEGRQAFDKNEENKLDTDVIIIDETSMVDIMLMQSLLKAVEDGTRLILVGDSDQLPSVGAGNVLKDIIASQTVKVVKLTEIFRQAQESAIIMNAHKINKGEYPALNEKNKDFFFIRKNNVEDVIDCINELTSDRIPKYLNCDKLSDIQVLTPMRKSILGVSNLNVILQNKLNPPNKKKKEKEYRSILFREGDKVMQIKNNYNTVWKTYSGNKQTDEGVGVYNGDEGRITIINETTESIRVLFDDGKVVDYPYSQLEELELSYAVTIHKSQGSEYKVVIIPVHSGPSMLLSRNLLYTAVTRAKKLVILVGIPDTLYSMVDNNREINRFSTLREKLIKLNNFMVD